MSSDENSVSLKEHVEALREADAKFQAERDRRYSEVAQEREKALKIKEEADRNALVLAREIQTYKDEKANELREQINRERVLYATKDDVKSATEKTEVIVAPLVTYVASQQGSTSGKLSQQQLLMAIVSLIGSLLLIGGIVITIAFAIRK